MKNWVILTFLYAVLNGFFHCGKKKSAEKNSIYEVLAYFSLIAFIIVALTSQNVFDIQLHHISMILLKSVILIIAWILNLYAMSKMTISLYSVINLSRIIFTILLSLIFLGEKLTINTLLGMIIVIAGLILVNKISNKNEHKDSSLKLVIILLFSCLLSSISSIIDKKILTSITSGQLQFWFLLFLTIGCWLILLAKNKKISIKSVRKNYWILITGICLAVGDKFLLSAAEIPESKVSIMTILQQFSAIEMILLGKIVFKEKHIIKKLLCSLLIILGIILTLV